MCKYCDPESYDEFDIAEKKLPYIRLTLRNDGGDLVIVARGDNDAYYAPKFCPECGRPVNSEGDV